MNTPTLYERLYLPSPEGPPQRWQTALLVICVNDALPLSPVAGEQDEGGAE